MTLDFAKENIGQRVVYISNVVQREGMRAAIVEDGVITSVNDTYVFVRYTGDQHSKATKPQDLRLLTDTV